MSFGPNTKAWVSAIWTSITVIMGVFIQALDDNSITVGEGGLIVASIFTGVSTVVAVYSANNDKN